MTIDDPVEAFQSIPAAYSPRVSPDDERVVCCWNETGRFELHAIHLETGERRQVTDGELPTVPEEPRSQEQSRHRWVGGDEVVFQGPKSDGSTTVFRAQLGGAVEELFSVDGSVFLWTADPESGRIYYRVGAETLRWHDPETGEQGDFPRFPGLPLTVPSTCAVSPDGEWIAYASLPPGTDWDRQSTYESGLTTYVARADGSDPRRVSPAGGGKRITPVQWHPDCDRLLVNSDEGNYMDEQKCGLYDRREDTVDWVADVGSVAFLDGGEQILAGPWPRSFIDLYDLDGNRTSVDCEGAFYLVSGAAAVAGDSAFVFIRRAEDRHFEAFHHDVTTSETTVLFGAEYEGRIVGPEAIVTPVETTYELHDGEEADGLLYRPPGASDQCTPAIVRMYGGRSWDRRFRPQVQLLAHLGYSVFLPDCPPDWWSHEEHEVFPAAGRWLAERDGIDENRVAACGHSHGGYNVLMQAVQYSEVWDAFVADSGPSDPADDPTDRARRQLGSPEENAAVYRELSPLEHLGDDVGRPLLLIHGENDSTVRPDQSRQFADALDDLGLTEGEEYEHRELPGTSHTPTEPDTKIRKWRVIADFLDRRL